jgi:hypothetical protein
VFIFTVRTFYLRVTEADYDGKLDKIEEGGSVSTRREVDYGDAVSRRSEHKVKVSCSLVYLVP